jgi:hypothetical protein
VGGRRRLSVALALWAAAGSGCGVIGDGERLTDAQEVIADMKIGPADPQAADLKIVGAVDHADRRYRVGEPIVLSVDVNQAAFVAVLQIMPSGATRLVFPNRRHASARLAANAPLSLPEAGGPAVIAAENPGVVLFEFAASTRGGSWLFNRKPQEGSDFAELGTTTRALAKDIVLSLGAGQGTAASHLALRVRGE